MNVLKNVLEKFAKHININLIVCMGNSTHYRQTFIVISNKMIE